ncbi:MAG TPA: hypothetical protein VHG72_14100 [Polyangia bacterium]|nr:hypothetical protein [Polyangia bacterium]
MALARSAAARDIIKADQDYGNTWHAQNLPVPVAGGDAFRLGDANPSGSPCLLASPGSLGVPTCGSPGSLFTPDAPLVFSGTHLQLTLDSTLTVSGSALSVASYALTTRATDSGANMVNLGALPSGIIVSTVTGGVSAISTLPNYGLYPSLTLYIDYDGGSDSNDCLTTTTPCKTFDGGLDPKIPSDGAGGNLIVVGLPRAGGATYLTSTGATENLATLGRLTNYQFVVIEGGWFRTGFAPTLGMMPASGTNASGYDVVSSPAPTTTSWTVTLHGGGAPSLAAEPTLEGYRWRWDATTPTALLRNTTAIILGNTGTNVTVAAPAAATPTAGDFGYIEAPGFAVGAPVYISGTKILGISNLYLEGMTVNGMALQGVQTSVVVSGVTVAGSSAISFNDLRGLAISNSHMNAVLATDIRDTMTWTGVRFLGITQLERVGEIALTRFFGEQMYIANSRCFRTPSQVSVVDDTTAGVCIGDVPGATTNTPSRLVATSGSKASITAAYTDLRIGNVNFEDNVGSFGFYYPIEFTGQNNSLYIDGMTANNSAYNIYGIVRIGNTNNPSKNNSIAFGPHQQIIANSSGTAGAADITLSSQSPLDGSTGNGALYALQLDTLNYIGSIVDGNGNKLTSYAGNGLTTARVTYGIWDTSASPPSPQTNDLGRFRVVRAKTSGGGLYDLPDSSSAANAANIVGVNIMSNPDPHGTQYDRQGAAMIVSEGPIPIITQDSSPTIPGPVWLAAGSPTGLVTTVKPATNAYQIGVAVADLGPFTENLYPQANGNPQTTTGRLLRVHLGPFNVQLGGQLSGPPGSASVIGLTETGGPTALTLGAIPANSFFTRNGSNAIVGLTSIPITSVAAPTGTGFAHVTSAAWDSAARAVDLSGADATGTLAAAREPAHTGDVTNSAGSLTLAFRSFAPLSVLGEAANSSGIPTEISTSSGSNGVFRENSGTIGFGNILESAVTNLTTDLGNKLSDPGANGIVQRTGLGATTTATWPTTGDVLFSAGTSSTPTGSADLTFASSVFTVGGNAGGYAKTVAGANGSGAVQFWIDSLPSFAGGIGLGIPGVAATHDLLLMTFNGSAWSERGRFVNGGTLNVASLAAGGMTKAAATSGGLAIATDGTDYLSPTTGLKDPGSNGIVVRTATGTTTAGQLSGPVTTSGTSLATSVNLSSAGFSGSLPLGDVAAPTGTGFPHVTSGLWDSAARAVNLSGSDVTSQLPLTGLAQGGASSTNLLAWSGTAWAPTAAPSSLPPSGTAGGALAGTYPNPTLAAVGPGAGTYGGSGVSSVTLNAAGQVTAVGTATYLTGNQTITLTGPITGSGSTSIATTLASIPNATPVAGDLLIGETGTPSAPSASTLAMWASSTADNLMVETHAGVISHTAQSKTCTTGQFFDELDDNGLLTCAAPSSGGTNYQTWQNQGSSLTQRATQNASTGLTAADNSGSSRTDLTVNLSSGVSGGQTLIGGTGSGESLTISTTSNATKGDVIIGGMRLRETNQSSTGVPAILLGTTSLASAAVVNQITTNVNNAVIGRYLQNTNAGSAAAVGDQYQNGSAIMVHQLDGSSFGTSGFETAGTMLYRLVLGSGNMYWNLEQSTGDFIWSTTSSKVGALRLYNAGDLVLGTSALSTSATDRFLYLTSMAGVPTGSATSYNSGASKAIVVDSTDERLYVNEGTTNWYPWAQDTHSLASGPLCNTTSTGVWSACTAANVSTALGTGSSTGILEATSGAYGTVTIGASTGLSYSGTTLSGVAFAASGSSHAQGMVPDPGSTTGTHRYLREDAAWVDPDVTTLSQSFYEPIGQLASFTNAAWLGNYLVASASPLEWGAVGGPLPTSVGLDVNATSINLVDSGGTCTFTVTATRNGSGISGASVSFTSAMTGGSSHQQGSASGLTTSGTDTYGTFIQWTNCQNTLSGITFTSNLRAY